MASGAPSAEVVSPPVGVADRGADPAVVAIDSGGAVPCAGALVAHDIVLTALHCVALREVPVVCGNGAPTVGSYVLQAPGGLRIFVGDDMTTAVQRARARDILVPADADVCGVDVALLFLDQPIDDVQPLVVRPTGAARGDHVRTVGFGVGPVGGLSGYVAAKVLRDHVAVTDTANRELEVAEMMFAQGGGPALDEAKGQIVGVVSRNGRAPFRDVYTRADAFTTLLERALGQSQSTPSSRIGAKKPRKGPADMGADCVAGSDCAAGVCVSAGRGTQQYCSRGCGTHDRCPARFRCERTQEGPEVCVET